MGNHTASGIVGARSERVKNVTALLLLVAAVVFAATTLLSRSRSLPSGFAQPEPTLYGRGIDSILASDPAMVQWAATREPGKSWVLYVFSVTCSACNQQKIYVTDLFSRVPRGRFLAVSSDPKEQLADYWSERLQEPLSIQHGTLTAIGIRAVPSLLIVRDDGIIHRSWVGQVTQWGPQTLLDSLGL